MRYIIYINFILGGIMKRYKYLISCLLVFILTIIYSTNIFAANTSTLEINSPSVILIERNTGNILYQKNAHEVRFPASTTKIMTAI